MTRCVLSGVPLVLVAVAMLSTATGSGDARAGAQDTPQTTFRSGASAVTVDVSVRDRSRRAITGLKATDFQVFDNGVLQRVDDVSYGKLPIDITVALDVSHSVTGALLDRLRQGVVQLMRDLGPQDRLKLVLFNMRIMRTIDWTNDAKAVERAIRGASAGGGTALLDAVSVTLVSGSAPDRRQLIVFFTDGSDSSSTTPPSVLTGIAQRTRATLTFVMPSQLRVPIVDSRGRTTTFATTGGAPLARAPLYPLFATLARETGGAILPVGPSADLSATFRKVLGDFRSAYVLYYTARGVEQRGHHTIEVKVNRDGAQVQARRGYFGS
ncbi:MAG TPA: VWA domain-containing protein [Vicinamibacterales bacterium]|nr:VWA domain-containing protein [Vicinamibacterales bacterium]